MRVLVNATNIKVGGGLQVAVSIINELLNYDRGISWYFVVSDQVYEQLSVDHLSCSNIVVSSVNFKATVFRRHQLLDSILHKFSPDLVFSIFGPTFWKPRRVKHIVGFANAWIVDKYNEAYSIFPFHKQLFYRIKNFILAKLLFDNNSIFITETEDIKQATISKGFVDSDKIFVVPNAPSQYFSEKFDSGKFKYLSEDMVFKFLSLTYNYPHKNLSTIPLVYNLLVEKGFKVKFVVTLPFREYEKQSVEFKKATINVGPVELKDAPSLYKNTNALYLPTLIECFTISYYEAMCMGKPIFTSDLMFAKELCMDKAFYFNPYDSYDIFCKLSDYLENKSFDCSEYNYLLKSVLSVEKKVDMFVSIIKSEICKHV